MRSLLPSSLQRCSAVNGMNGASRRVQTEQSVASSLLPSQPSGSRRRYHLRSVSIPNEASCSACRVWKFSRAAVIFTMCSWSRLISQRSMSCGSPCAPFELHDGRIEPLDLLFRGEDEFVSPVKVLPGLGTAGQKHPDRIGTELAHRIFQAGRHSPSRTTSSRRLRDPSRRRPCPSGVCPSGRLSRGGRSGR